MSDKFLSWTHLEGVPYLVLLQSPGPLSAWTAPGGNTPALRSLGEGAHREPAPSARPEEGGVLAGGLMWGALTPWPHAPVCRQPGTGARPYGGSADPAPWVLRALSDGESSLLRSWTALRQVCAGSLRSSEAPARSGRSLYVKVPRRRPAVLEWVCPQVAPPPRAGTAPDQTVSFLTLPSTSPAGTRPERVLAPPPRTLTQEQSPRPDSNSIASEVERASETAQVVGIGIRSLDLGSPRNQKPRQRARRDWARQPKTAWTRREDCRARISHPASPHSESPSRCPSVDSPTPSLFLGLPKVTAAFSAACTQLSPSETSLPSKDPSHGSPSCHYQGPISHTHSAGFLQNKSLLLQISPLCF